jgi:hypothetical protein
MPNIEGDALVERTDAVLSSGTSVKTTRVKVNALVSYCLRLDIDERVAAPARRPRSRTGLLVMSLKLSLLG